MKKQTVVAIIGIIAALGLLLGFNLWGKVLGERPAMALGGRRTQPLATKFISKQAPLVASVLVNPDRLTLASRLATPPGERRRLNQEWQQWKTLLQQNWLIDYDRYIRPWLGQELTLAVTTTDLDRDSSNGFQPGYLMAMAMGDQRLAQSYLEKFWQNLATQGANLLFEQHEGIPLITTETTPSLSGAILGNYVLFANDPRVIRNAINDLQVSDLALANFPRYRATIEGLTQKRIGLAFINLEELGTWGREAGFLGTALGNLPSASLGVGFSIKGNQLQGETLLIADRPWGEVTNQVSQPNALVHLLPPNATVFVGHNLQRTWEELRSALTPYPSLQKLAQSSLQQLADRIGFDLEQDFFSWIKGDYAVAILPGQAFNWLLLAEPPADINVQNALDRLDRIAQERLTVGKVKVEGQELTVWTDLQASDPTIVKGAVHAVHGNTDRVVGFASSVPALISALHPARPNRALPPQDFAYFHRSVSLPALPALLQETMPGIGELVQPLLPHIQSATIARLPEGNKLILRGEISLALQ
jgi:hypothetical protein